MTPNDTMLPYPQYIRTWPPATHCYHIYIYRISQPDSQQHTATISSVYPDLTPSDTLLLIYHITGPDPQRRTATIYLPYIRTWLSATHCYHIYRTSGTDSQRHTATISTAYPDLTPTTHCYHIHRISGPDPQRHTATIYLPYIPTWLLATHCYHI